MGTVTDAVAPDYTFTVDVDGKVRPNALASVRVCVYACLRVRCLQAEALTCFATHTHTDFQCMHTCRI